MQTARSAAVAVVLVGWSVTAIADPDDGASAAADPADPQPSGDDAQPPTDDAPPPTDDGAGAPATAAAHAPTGRFQIGAGFGTDDGFVAVATVAQDDLFRTGVHLSLSARMSEREQLSRVRVADPTLLGSDLTLSADLYAQLRELPGVVRRAAGGVATLSRPLGGHWRGFLGYRLEHVSAERADGAAGRGAASPLAPGLISALRAGLEYDDVDLPAWPRRGTRAGVLVEHADRRLGSELELDRAKGWLQHHQPLGPLTLHLGFAGEAIHTNDARGLPRSERLYLDGSSDLRGYKPGALAPFGGDLKLTGRAELEVPLVRSIGLSAAGFVDVGGIWDRFGAAATGHSFGAGLRWHSPIGTLSFDWAFTAGARDPVFVFSIGL